MVSCHLSSCLSGFSIPVHMKNPLPCARWQLKSFGYQSFSAQGPLVWNNLRRSLLRVPLFGTTCVVLCSGSPCLEQPASFSAQGPLVWNNLHRSLLRVPLFGTTCVVLCSGSPCLEQPASFSAQGPLVWNNLRRSLLRLPLFGTTCVVLCSGSPCLEQPACSRPTLQFSLTVKLLLKPFSLRLPTRSYSNPLTGIRCCTWILLFVSFCCWHLQWLTGDYWDGEVGGGGGGGRGRKESRGWKRVCFCVCVGVFMCVCPYLYEYMHVHACECRGEWWIEWDVQNIIKLRCVLL